MGALADQQEARIAEGLEQMEQMQLAQDARSEEAQARQRIQSQLGELGGWLVLWAPRLHAGALLGARTAGTRGPSDEREAPR